MAGRAAVIGLGLIGGSLAAALKSAYDDVVGWDRDAVALESALAAGLIDGAATTLYEAVAGADLVVLATFIEGIVDILQDVGGILKPGAMVIDTGSTKLTVVNAMNSLPEHVNAIGGHPMTGKRTADVDYATPQIFQDTLFVLTPTQRTTPEMLEAMQSLVVSIGAIPIVMEASQHDKLVALISHLAPIIPLALLTAAQAENDDRVWTLAAGSFREMTRLASEDLGFWLDVIKTNNRGIPAAIRAVTSQLDRLAALIETDDIERFLRVKEAARAEWQRCFAVPQREKATRSTVAYLGIRGSYSEQAARQHFGDDLHYIACQSFDQIFERVENGEATYGILPMENTLAGAVSQSYELLTEHTLRVQAEVILRVDHALMAMPGTTVAMLKSVRSHPQALAQCTSFLKTHRLEPTNWYSTAGAAQDLAAHPHPEIGAIASREVAELYGLSLLATDIQDEPHNYTRFFILGQADAPPAEVNKTSIIFTVKHEPGALAACLDAIAQQGINMSKIESRPTRDTPWVYNFYIDFEGHLDDEKTQATLNALQERTEFLRVLGSYPVAVTL